MPRRCAVIGRGRLGTALAAALREARCTVDGPLGRGANAAGADVVLLCVPDAEIANAAAHVAPGPLVGHCSGALGLNVIGTAGEAGGCEAFGLHPLMTVTADGADFAGAGCAVAGSTPRALAIATALANRLGMRSVTIDDEDRAAYHAAASIASNFLVTLEAAAERLAATTRTNGDLLAPLVRATVENWATHGPERALTGPIARGDHETVARQRQAVATRTPELLPLFDTMADTTRALVANGSGLAVVRGCFRGGPEDEVRGPRPDPGDGHPDPYTTTPDHHPSPQTVRTVADLRAALEAPRQAGRSIGLVPTMGAFHEGHLSLMRRARAECDVVVVSLFVNPTQFAPGEDLEAYPRDERRDAELAAAEGVDVLFAPPVEEVYPHSFATSVAVDGHLTETLEGALRGAEHFGGVATVVTKLFNMARPDAAYFGQKDAQQAVVIRRLARDLDIPVEIVVCPTVREPDGLAMSSRNAYLDASERTRALALRHGLDAAEAAVAAGERDPAAVAGVARAAMAEHGVEPEYLQIVHPETLSPVAAIDGEALVAVAARVGRARLIDNTIARAPAGVANGQPTREAPCSV